MVCGCGTSEGAITNAVWRLDLAELRWERMSSLTLARRGHACCALRGTVVVLGGKHAPYIGGTGQSLPTDCFTASLEILGYDSETEERIFKALPPMACIPYFGHCAVPIDESESELGQVLLIGGDDGEDVTSVAHHKLDLATGVCTPLPSLLSDGSQFCTAARLPDGRLICMGTSEAFPDGITAEVLEPPQQGNTTIEASWRWRQLPGMSVARFGCGGCVLSDGRFAVFGGTVFGGTEFTTTSSCDVLTLDGGERWEPLPHMHEERFGFACEAVGGCVIVAGGFNASEVTRTVEVYEEALGHWRRLPCSLPIDAAVTWASSALM